MPSKTPRKNGHESEVLKQFEDVKDQIRSVSLQVARINSGLNKFSERDTVNSQREERWLKTVGDFGVRIARLEEQVSQLVEDKGARNA